MKPAGAGIVEVSVALTVVEAVSVTIVVDASARVTIVLVICEITVAVSVIVGRIVVSVEMAVVVEVVVDAAGVIVADGVDFVILKAYHGSVRKLYVVLTDAVGLRSRRVKQVINDLVLT